MASMQQVIQQLSMFWDGKGCAVLPPCAFRVPMGLLHPQAFFRLLEPDPWMAAFLQPISRPADSRAGTHPYRTGRHLQFQVIWKAPEPTDPHNALMESLELLGAHRRDHDLRWTEIHTEVAALGASGHGWQVELDGLDIARINFLDRLAERAPAVPVVEIAYGIERLALFLGGAEDVYAVPWQGAIDQHTQEGTREKRREVEVELHRYSTEVANVGYLQQVVDGLDRESGRCLKAGLPQAAYELAVRALPALDHLEARGALPAAERRHWLEQIRARVCEAADLYQGTHGLNEIDPDDIGRDDIDRDDIDPGEGEHDA